MSPRRVKTPVRNADRQCGASGHQRARRRECCARIGQLIESVPDRNGVERAILGSRCELDEITVVNDEAECPDKCVDARVDVDALEAKTLVARGGEECPRVAPDLQSAATSAKSCAESAGEPAHGWKLGRVKCTKRVCRRRGVLVDRREF